MHVNNFYKKFTLLLSLGRWLFFHIGEFHMCTINLHSLLSFKARGLTEAQNENSLFLGIEEAKQIIMQASSMFSNIQITFDDCIYQQKFTIPVIAEAFPDIPIYIFPSGRTIRTEQEPELVYNALAHTEYHDGKYNNSYPSAFMSSTEIWDIARKHSNIKIGSHGWYHLNFDPYWVKQLRPGNVRSFIDNYHLIKDSNGSLNIDKIREREQNPERISFGTYLTIIKEDACLAASHYLTLVQPFVDRNLNKEDKIIEFYYCTPYNYEGEYQKVYIELFEKQVQDEFRTREDYKEYQAYTPSIKVFSGERIDLEFAKQKLGLF